MQARRSRSRRIYIGLYFYLPLGYEFMGEQQVKNIAEPVRAYRVTTGHRSNQAVPHSDELPKVSNRLSIAVLPFANMSGDPDQEYFAMTHLVLAYLNTGQLELALNWARLAVQRETDFIEAPVALASILAHSGKEEEARTVLTQFGIQDISSIETRPFWYRYLYPTTAKLVFDGLRKAGMGDKPPLE